MIRFLPLILVLPLAACATGYKGVDNPHQPVVSANAAKVQNCPDWSVPTLGANEGQSSNYGCATAINLAAMIADPADLLHGRADRSGQSDVGTRAIKAWREAVPTSKQWQTTTSVSSKGGNQ
ncbi:CpaD family pilus assembly lipoprotein [Sphingomonas nostoxanthinifaciens]|uniref:CpaD family pilus assembly lipoprotein n=1 Tax=Sphingomonas nostoxanthinifaciens TaxID=2872652 RepID=UPI001CC1C35E|nr:CpaD family pilus assembly lipoprotein [Sphingomonas nostoxanthinifaciens]UAK24106.1 CpaD family pilus assembly protein [Sphingomonas nostoxanthinifaciens]